MSYPLAAFVAAVVAVAAFGWIYVVRLLAGVWLELDAEGDE